MRVLDLAKNCPTKISTNKVWATVGITAKMVLSKLIISIDDGIKLAQLQYGYFELTQTPPLNGSSLTQNTWKSPEWHGKAL